MDRKSLIDAAQGKTESDLLLANARMVNVLTGAVERTDVAVFQGRISALEKVPARRVLDLEGRFLCPGFIDGHVHLESAMVTVPQAARVMVPRGTTAVVADPHEIANVHGLEGVRYILESSRGLPMDVFVMAPSCVPATHLETSGAALSAGDIASLYAEPRVLGLAEMMNFPGVLAGDPSVLEKIAGAKSGRVDGHAPGLSGAALSAYIAAGIGTDHECTTADEAAEKVRKGMVVLIREGTAAKNLEALLPAVTPASADRFAFCTDDRHPFDLVHEGHMDQVVRRAVSLGLDPVLAVKLATVNPARAFGLRDRGAVVPGARADLAVFDDLSRWDAQIVIKDGRVVAEKGKPLFGEGGPAVPAPGPSVRMRPLELAAFRIAAGGRRVRAIRLVPDQIVTGSEWVEAKIEDGAAAADPARDLLKLAVVERHRATGRIGLGFVRGFGLKRGALGSSVAHDSHNLVAVAASDTDLRAAVEALALMQGGLVVVENGNVTAALPLPVAGLLSPEPVEAVSASLEGLKAAARSLGCAVADPFMHLSFLALPVIPELKLTDRGLVDVGAFGFTPLFG